MTTHQMCKKKEYQIWQRMKTACYNKKNSSYKTYGARGIGICEDWKENFYKFFLEMGQLPADCTGIELIDMSKDFSLENCRWVSSENRRRLNVMPNTKNRLGIKKYKDPRRMSISFDREYFDFLQRQAIEKSRQTGVPISTMTFVTDVIKKHVPMNSQTDMFNEKK